MVWPLLAIGVGVSALAARSALRSLKASNVRPFTSPILIRARTWLLDATKNLQGFEQPMSTTEAYKILNVSPLARRDIIVQAHRNLMLRNHPDNGGSNFVASKVNEAKELLLGSKNM